MSKAVNVAQEVKKLNLPLGEYVVVGSGPLAVRGLRQTEDVDLMVSQRVYDDLKRRGWVEEHFPGSGRDDVLFDGCFDVSTTWSIKDRYAPKLEELAAHADVIDGIAFVSLADLRMWKQICARDKDLHDLKLIDEYIQRQASR